MQLGKTIVGASMVWNRRVRKLQQFPQEQRDKASGGWLAKETSPLLGKLAKAWKLLLMLSQSIVGTKINL